MALGFTLIPPFYAKFGDRIPAELWAQYEALVRTGEPTFRSPPFSATPNWTPRVTWPSWTSRHGMTRFAITQSLKTQLSRKANFSAR